MSERKLEEEYFKKLQSEATDKLKQKLDQQAEEKATQDRLELHFHRCGKCGSEMSTQTFRGIEIEVCPNCKAVLLDPGELELVAGTDQSGIVQSFFSMFGGSKEP